MCHRKYIIAERNSYNIYIYIIFFYKTRKILHDSSNEEKLCNNEDNKMK